MKSKRIRIAVIAIALVIVFGVVIVQFAWKESEPVMVINDVSKEEVMTLDFGGADVLVLGNKGSDVKIVASISVEDSGVVPEIEHKENFVKLINYKSVKTTKNIKNKVREWVSLLKSEANILGYHFTIYVPKNVSISVIADNVRVEYCNLIYVECGEAIIRNCNIQKEFISKAKNNKVRDCKISKDSTFEEGIDESRDNTYKD